MWFLSLLVLFFFVFSLLYSIRKDWFDRVDQPVMSQRPSVSSTLKFLFGIRFLALIYSSDGYYVHRGNELVFTLFGDAFSDYEIVVADGWLAGDRYALDTGLRRS